MSVRGEREGGSWSQKMRGRQSDTRGRGEVRSQGKRQGKRQGRRQRKVWDDLLDRKGERLKKEKICREKNVKNTTKRGKNVRKNKRTYVYLSVLG